jgi:molybdenum-dependent DNA-binding transcriptional regulator ModE
VELGCAAALTAAVDPLLAAGPSWNACDTGQPFSAVEEEQVDLVSITSFVAVVRTGSFTGAARELGYGQSTVSGHVRALERSLRVALVQRDPGGARPTPAGAALLPHALAMLRAAVAARGSCARTAAEAPERPLRGRERATTSSARSSVDGAASDRAAAECASRSSSTTFPLAASRSGAVADRAEARSISGSGGRSSHLAPPRPRPAP